MVTVRLRRIQNSAYRPAEASLTEGRATAVVLSVAHISYLRPHHQRRNLEAGEWWVTTSSLPFLTSKEQSNHAPSPTTNH
jgi:hypothetical protein